MADIIKKLHALNSRILEKCSLKKHIAISDESVENELLAIEQQRVNLYTVDQPQHYTAQLHIEQSNVEAFYLNVKNKSSYEETLQLLVADLNELKCAIQAYLEEGQQSFPVDIQKSISHIVKYLELFQGRLERAQSLNDAKFIRTSDYREAAREKISDLFASSFNSRCLQVIYDGFRVEQKKRYYVEIANHFNAFLVKQGIYSKLFKPYDEIDFELLIPESKKSTTDEGLNGRIADLYMLPYFFNDPHYQGHALISEGNCVAYSTQ